MAELFDISATDEYNENNQPKELNQEEALQQALKLFVLSDEDDYIRSTSPGLIKTFLFKQLSNRNKTQLIFRLKNTIINEFTPAIYLQSINVTQDPVKLLWKISITYISPYTGVPKKVDILVKDFSDRQREYQTIPINYTGVNLEQWARQKKIMMPDTKMLYNKDTEKYSFGIYVLNDFYPGTSNFATIQAILNG